MKILGFIFAFALAAQVQAKAIHQESFEKLSIAYKKAKQPTQEQLQETRWKPIALANDYSLAINQGSQDKFDKAGIKNLDGSQMMWSFDSYDSQDYKLTVSKLNLNKKGKDHLLINVHFLKKEKSAAFGFSAYEEGTDSDIYFIQNCRITKEELLICPAILKVAPNAVITHAIDEAKDKVNLIQVFSRY